MRSNKQKILFYSMVLMWFPLFSVRELLPWKSATDFEGSRLLVLSYGIGGPLFVLIYRMAMRSVERLFDKFLQRTDEPMLRALGPMCKPPISNIQLLLLRIFSSYSIAIFAAFGISSFLFLDMDPAYHRPAIGSEEDPLLLFHLLAGVVLAPMVYFLDFHRPWRLGDQL